MTTHPFPSSQEVVGHLAERLIKVVDTMLNQQIRVVALETRNAALEVEVGKLNASVRKQQAELLRLNLSLDGIYRCIDRLEKRCRPPGG